LPWLTFVEVRLGVPAPTEWLGELTDITSRLDVTGSVQIVCDLNSTVPLATGVFRSVILMPIEAVKWSIESRRYALSHELVHIERRDVMWQLLGQIAAGLYWFNPLIWYALRRLRIEREFACDDRVVQLTGRASDYATQLVEIARLARSPDSMSAAVAMAQASDLEQRLQALFDRARSHMPLSRKRSVRLAVAAVAMLAVVVAVKPVARVLKSEALAQVPAEQTTTQSKEILVNTLKLNSVQVAAERAAMRIQVIDVLGKPIPDATIHSSVWEVDEANDPDEPNRDWKTDANGIAMFDRPSRLRILRLWVSHPDFVTVFTGWEEAEPHENGRLLPKEFTFSLPKGIEIGGQVVDVAGQPIANAHVDVNCGGGPVDPARPEVRFASSLAHGKDRAVTDQQGRWIVKNVPTNFDRGGKNDVTLRFNHSNYLAVPGEEQFPVHPEFTTDSLRKKTLRTTLKSGLRLEGLIKDPSGKPIEGAIIIRCHTQYLRHGDPEEERTDAQGHYRLPALPPGRLTVMIIAPGWSPLMQEVNLTDESKTADFQLQPGHRLKLKIVDQFGKPVSKCYVGVQTWKMTTTFFSDDLESLNSRIPKQTDEEGNYVWDWAPGDAVKYQIAALDYVTQELELTAVNNDSTSTVTLRRDPKITGTVSDAVTGGPIPQFTVHVTAKLGPDSYAQDEPTPKSETGGQFSLQIDRADVPHVLLIEADGYRAKVGRSFHIQDGNHHEAFRLERAPAIKGRVLNALGEPVKAAKVHYVTRTTHLEYNSADHFHGRAPVVTDAGGRFQFIAQSGPWTLIVMHANGYGRLDLAQDGQPGDIALQPWAQIDGVLLQAGRPVPHAFVYVNVLRDAESDANILMEGRQTRTTADGRFSLQMIPPTRVQLRPELSVFRDSLLTSGRNVPIDLRPGQKIELNLGGPGAEITGRIVLKGDVPEGFNLTYSSNYLARRGSALAPRNNLKAIATQVRKGWTEALWQTADGEAYMQLHELHVVRVDSNGQFLINGVSPGDYDFAISVYGGRDSWKIDPIAVKIVPVTVTHADVERGRMILPDIELPFPERSKIGEVLPEISLPLSSGEVLKLSQFRGKALVLHTWATWNRSSLGTMLNLKRLQSRFPADKLTFIGINRDRDLKLAQELASQNELHWIQSYVGLNSEACRRLELSVNGTYAIISSEGKLLLRTTDLAVVQQELEKLLKP
jgi:uncharacterized GH25 family protein